MASPCIMIVGAADTGRAPMAAALLRRLLAARGLSWNVESAGILGHDDAPAETEARDAMAVLGADIGDHHARSLTDELVAGAAAIATIDSGVARVVRLRYPAAAARVQSLGELAARTRDIPDPFRMQVGAWISYAREIEALLAAGIERLTALVEDGGRLAADDEQPSVAAPPREPLPAEPLPPEAGRLSPAERTTPIDRCERLLALILELPAVVEWAGARRQLEADIAAAAATSLGPADLAQPYAAMLQALLGMAPALPTPGQIALLRTALGRLRAPIDQAALAALAAEVAGWANA